MLAGSANARLVLVRVLPSRAPGSAVDELDAIQVALNLDAESLRADGHRVETAVRRVRPIQAEDVARAIAEVADEQQAGLIVMSTHGRSGLGRWIYGGVAECILRQSSIPVLLVPPAAERPLPQDRSLRLLVPLDGSELAEEALTSLEPLTGTIAAELHLLRIVEPPYLVYGDGNVYTPTDPEALVTSAREYLLMQAERLQAQGFDVTAQATAGKASSVVTQVARETEVDLIVMATHGRSGLARLVLGSVALSILQQANVPVLLVRPATMQHSERPPSDGQASDASTVMASAATPDSVPTVDVMLSGADLELLERGLNTLAHTPGHDHHLVTTIRALSERLNRAVRRLEADEDADAQR
jgi:nucleotide-binding universal stress UspA family protein